MASKVGIEGQHSSGEEKFISNCVFNLRWVHARGITHYSFQGWSRFKFMFKCQVCVTFNGLTYVHFTSEPRIVM